MILFLAISVFLTSILLAHSNETRYDLLMNTKTCSKCHKIHDLTKPIDFKGFQQVPDSEPLVLFNCECKSTLAVYKSEVPNLELK